ncbi:hypothetical protein NTD86_21035 [Pseudomonas sp. 7P_10.2_Bac1]|uniref:hypothetical protein n=1 Tax=Pseudomonas sp. 7P_10.2_Bac1 TaxID=2971614 RepID=UPI0021C74CBF|nr:hypothetical protein [Pseudomonas sp. 7P_10.2_Bac1]MCU1729463.1 hypothetical protein [Pseudomonas sp. 7P_10.2_Bac1]
MALIRDVQLACARLAPHGWASLLLQHGLDITAADLQQELTKPLSVDRSLKGFEDFSPAGWRGIEAGRPAQSLLYHAFASPNVLSAADASPLTAFPSALEIEQVLNFVYGINPPSLETLRAYAGAAPLAIVVFAYEYRPRPETVHKAQADLCFSRTGVARVGTAPALYDPARRGFLPFVEADAQQMRVIPARYGAYIAMQKAGDSDSFGPMSFQSPTDAGLNFWVPIHKLFGGGECLQGLDLSVQLQNYQINEKIGQVHRMHKNTGWQEPDILNYPFVITEGLCDWADPEGFGMGLLVPEAKERLVEKAYYQGQLLSFIMPPGTGGLVHGRSSVRDDGEIEDLNNVEGVDALVKAGGYRALHYQDAMADGWVLASCPELAACGLDKDSIAAYSIIGAPDFFPLCGQRELKAWSSDPDVFPCSTPPCPEVWHTRVNPLSDVRFQINPTLEGNYFADDDITATAIVSMAFEPSAPDPVWNDSEIALAQRQSCLPDFASGVFGPGWEVGRGTVDKPFANVLNGYMLASPFTEDARICAALGSFWPGVAPDSTRTFEPRGLASSVIPLTDAEIGLTDAPSWDGLKGPVLVDLEGRQVVQYQAYEYSDYTLAALDGKLSLAVTGHITTEQYHERVLAMHRAYRAVGAVEKPGKRLWSVLSFTFVQQPDEALDAAQLEAGHSLEGQVMYLCLYQHGAIRTPAGEFKRRHVDIESRVHMYVSQGALLVKQDDTPWCLQDESL